MKIQLTSIHSYLPGEKIPSAYLDKLCGLREGYIEKSTGVKFRYQADKKETLSDMAARALNGAMHKAGLKPSDIDLLISAGGTFDQPIPHNACLIKAKITDDSNPFPCFDVDSTCLSFVNGLDIAHMYIQSGRYNRIAIVSAEMPSRAIHKSDPGTFGLFGDAAVAVIIEKGEGYLPMPGKFLAYPSGSQLAGVKLGGVANRALGRDAEDAGFFFKMEGRPMMRLAKEHLGNFLNNIEREANLVLQDLDYILPHQASKHGNQFFIENYGLSKEKVITTLEEYGNCISASIPLGWEKIMTHSEEPLRGKNLLLIGTAAGFSLGGMVMKF